MFRVMITSNPRYSDINLAISCKSSFTDNFSQAFYNSEESGSPRKKLPQQSILERLSTARSGGVLSPSISSAGGIPSEKIENPNKQGAIEIMASNEPKYFDASSIRRVRAKLNQIITANICSQLKFITLTYDNEHLPDDFAGALRSFQNFQERFQKYWCSNGLGTAKTTSPARIIGIPEKGEKNGRIHWHCIIVCPFVKKEILQNRLWRNGFVDVVSIRLKQPDEIAKQISAYLTKYLSKGVEKWAGRTCIYYASKNWQQKKKVALMSEQQGRKAFDWLKFCEKQGICSSPFISLTNFDGVKIDESERAAFIARCRLPRKLDLLPAHFVSFRFRLPRKTADNFVRFCESLFVDFQERKILGKSKSQRATEDKIRLQNRAFRETMFDRSKIDFYTDKLSKAFPHVNAGYIYGVLRHQNKFLDRDLQINNFYLMNKFHDKIDIVNDNIPKYLRKQLTVYIHRDERVQALSRWKFLRKFRYSDAFTNEA